MKKGYRENRSELLAGCSVIMLNRYVLEISLCRLWN